MFTWREIQLNEQRRQSILQESLRSQQMWPQPGRSRYLFLRPALLWLGGRFVSLGHACLTQAHQWDYRHKPVYNQADCARS